MQVKFYNFFNFIINENNKFITFLPLTPAFLSATSGRRSQNSLFQPETGTGAKVSVDPWLLCPRLLVCIIVGVPAFSETSFSNRATLEAHFSVVRDKKHFMEWLVTVCRVPLRDSEAYIQA